MSLRAREAGIRPRQSGEMKHPAIMREKHLRYLSLL